MSGCVYVVRCDLSGAHYGRRYVGQTTQEPEPHRRMARHIRSAAAGSNFPFHQAIREVGAEHFFVEYVYKTSSQYMLNKLEAFWALELNAYCWGHFDGEYPPGYNCAIAGRTNRMLGKKHKPDSLEKMAAARKKYWATRRSHSSSEASSSDSPLSEVAVGV